MLINMCSLFLTAMASNLLAMARDHLGALGKAFSEAGKLCTLRPAEPRTPTVTELWTAPSRRGPWEVFRGSWTECWNICTFQSLPARRIAASHVFSPANPRSLL